MDFTIRLDDITVSIYKEGSGLTAFVGKDKGWGGNRWHQMKLLENLKHSYV